MPRVSHNLCYAQEKTAFVQGLGLMDWSIQTRRMAVGSYLGIKMAPFALPLSGDAMVLGMHVAITQSVRLISRQSRHYSYGYSEPKRFALLDVDGKTLQENQGAWDWLVQIPSCKILRPSTLLASKEAAIRIAHHMEISIDYWTEKVGKRMNSTYRFKWPVVLASVSAKSAALCIWHLRCSPANMTYTVLVPNSPARPTCLQQATR